MVGERSAEFVYTSATACCGASYRIPALLRMVGPLAPGTRILDVGCGNGHLAGLLAARGHLVVGIDLSQSGVAVARRTYPDVRFEVVGAGRDMLDALGGTPFDLVVSTEVVEHLYSPGAFAEGCHRALRPAGRLVCSTPYHGYVKNLALAVTNSFDRHWGPLDEGGHIKFWSRSTLSRLLCEVGFCDLRFSGAGRLPLLWRSMLVSARRPG